MALCLTAGPVLAADQVVACAVGGPNDGVIASDLNLYSSSQAGPKFSNGVVNAACQLLPAAG
jgi:hypothetical protein